MDGSAKELSKRIDEALMELDYQLCQRAMREGTARDLVGQVDLPSATLVTLLTAFRRDANLWAEFSWEVGAPREPAFERLYQRAQLVGRCQGEASDSPVRQQAHEACDPNGLCRRIQALAENGPLDGLTVTAVAYVLGRKPALWRAVQTLVVRHG